MERIGEDMEKEKQELKKVSLIYSFDTVYRDASMKLPFDGPKILPHSRFVEISNLLFLLMQISST